MMLEKFEVGTFEPHLGEIFRIQAADSHWSELTLTEATALGTGADVAGLRAPFSIVFLGPREQALPQGTYRVEHAAIGAFELFLVPIGPDEAGMRYEAVFG
jgi:hypothetical protein